MPSNIQDISLVALLSITTLSFAFSERIVAFLSYISFVNLLTGTVNCAAFEKRFAFLGSIVKYCV